VADDDLIQISVGGFRVGIAGLQQAIEEAINLPGQNEEEIAEVLLLKLKSRKYIPNPAREDY
jgi:hypothetical protein